MFTNISMIKLLLLIISFVLASSINCGGIVVGTGTCTSCNYCSSGSCLSCCSGYGTISSPSSSCSACTDSSCAYCYQVGTVSEYCGSCKLTGYYSLTGTVGCIQCTAGN